MASAAIRIPFQLAFAVLLLIFWTTAIVTVVIICLPLKLFALACARIFRKDLLHFIQGSGCIFSQDKLTSAPNGNLCQAFMFDGHIELEKVISIFQERVIEKVHPHGKFMYPELQQYWTPFLNYMFWTPVPKFDVRNHVRLYDYGKVKKTLKLPEGICTENDLRRAFGPLLEEPWKEAQSPWELLLVQNFKSAGSLIPSTAVIFRIHHAMADGYCIVKLLLRDLMLVPPKIEINFPKIRWWEKLGLRILLPFKLPWDMAGSFMNAFDGNHCWHSLTNNPKLSRKLYTALSKAIDIQVFKDVKNKYGVGYNAVLCSVSAGACRRIMEDAGQVVPKEMSCFVPIPLPNHPDGLINHVTSIVFRLAMEKTERDRLEMIAHRISPSKYSTEMLGYILLAKIGTMTPNIILRKARLLSAVSAVVFSSLPVGQDGPKFVGLGVKLVDLFSGVGPGMGTIGVYMTPTSVNGKQRITVNIDQALVPSDEVFQKFAQYVDDELEALLMKPSFVDKQDFKNK